VFFQWIIFNCNVARMGEERGVHRVLVGKPEGKRLLGIPRRTRAVFFQPPMGYKKKTN
jgi:hypothetical protein